MNTEVKQYIATASEEHQEIMNIVHAIILQTVPNVIVEFKWSRPVYKCTKDFAYLKSNKNYVTLGFYSGFEKLNDPNNLLEGTGKLMRHIKIKAASDINATELKEWFTILTKK